MPTQYLYRLTLIAPVALQSALNAWITANIDPAGGPWLQAVLSSTGTAPATHCWFNSALTLDDLTAIANQICAMASITLPSDWATETFDQQHSWFLSNAAAVKSANGITTDLCDNTGTWTEPNSLLPGLGLQVIETGS